jgi:HPt (histidine-containing phosphotransfer) domain-containing protein
LGGDRQLFVDIVGIFLEDAPAILDQAAAALAEGDSEAVARAAHTLRGMAANFAAESAVAAAYAIESHARSHRLENAAGCFGNLKQQVEALQAALREFRGHEA